MSHNIVLALTVAAGPMVLLFILVMLAYGGARQRHAAKGGDDNLSFWMFINDGSGGTGGDHGGGHHGGHDGGGHSGGGFDGGGHGGH